MEISPRRVVLAGQDSFAAFVIQQAAGGEAAFIDELRRRCCLPQKRIAQRVWRALESTARQAGHDGRMLVWLDGFVDE